MGEGSCQQDELAVAVELRTINSRYFKLSVRGAEGYGALEPQMESVVRQYIRRGTVQLQLRIDREATSEDFKLK